MNLRNILTKNFKKFDNPIYDENLDCFCNNCLWFFKGGSSCVHNTHPQNPKLVNKEGFCEWRFDLKTGYDYDKDTINYYKKNNPQVVQIDSNGREYV